MYTQTDNRTAEDASKDFGLLGCDTGSLAGWFPGCGRNVLLLFWRIQWTENVGNERAKLFLCLLKCHDMTAYRRQKVHNSTRKQGRSPISGRFSPTERTIWTGGWVCSIIVLSSVILQPIDLRSPSIYPCLPTDTLLSFIPTYKSRKLKS
jgi:hypothetical protein